MTSYFALVLFLIVQTCAIHGSIVKSSLTFVIDNTYSMHDEIRQVKEETNAVFDAVLHSGSSQIENFILVTFKDPGVQERANTKDRVVFKKAVADIVLEGNWDCPEYAMEGIELGLELSLPRSYLFVFTDAAAKDFYNYERVQALAQKKQIQIVFLLTGNCGAESDENYQVYTKVAEATSGQVFHMKKSDIKDVLAYVKEIVKSRGEVVLTKTLPPGYHNKIAFPVDGKTKEVLISASGNNPKIEDVTGPDGSKPKFTMVIEKPRIAVGKIKDPKVGIHEVVVGSRSETRAVITEKTSIHFVPGFSPIKPTLMKTAATRPPPDGDAYLAIQLEGEGVKLDNAKILDLHDNVIMELPLEIVSEEDKFYVTRTPFDAPRDMFKVAVTGHDIKTGDKLTRVSPTPIKRQDFSTVKTKNVVPQVTIDGKTDLKVDYMDPLQLKCKVHGYPKPEITWVETETGTVLPSKVSIIEVPYDYISVLDITKVDRTGTYECKARNSGGQDKKVVHVEFDVYFNVIETPTNLKLKYNTDGKFVCKVDSKPLNTVTWYKDGKSFTGDSNVEFSTDNSVLTIRHMQLEHKGNYSCEVKNEFNKKVFHSFLEIYGTDPPLIEKAKAVITVEKGGDVVVPCRIIKGTPTPTIRWYHQRKGSDKFKLLKEKSETLQVNNADVLRPGTYKCVAKNALGSDTFVTELIVEYPPKITNRMTDMKVKEDDKIELPCEVDGVPAPEVAWYFNGTRVESVGTKHISADNTLKFRATVADIGNYKCKASNKLGVNSKSVQVDVYVPINIEIPKETIIETMVGKSVKLPCRADGYPRPDKKWMFNSIDPRVPPKEIKPAVADHIDIKSAQLDQRGFYTCLVSNIEESANITYEVKVFAPPAIENVYKEKTFRVVDGDLVHRIQCKVTGSPEPSITWMKDGKNITLGAEWYEMEADGTLIIKNINDKAKGTYVCLAKNIIGQDSEMYDVVVDDFPKDGPTTNILTRTGVPLDIKCDIPHKKTDLLRWYKFGKIIAYGELSIPDVTMLDGGRYTCRVSDFTKSRSAHVDVRIGFAPAFVSVEETNIEFVYKDSAFLSCDVAGIPEPKITWTHNGEVMLGESDSVYGVEMSYKDIGEYVCEATNEFGTVHRNFTITTKDCILDLKKDFPTKQPVMVSSTSEWPTFEAVDGYMKIPQGVYFYLLCPNGFADAPLTKEYTAFCEKENKIIFNGKLYGFSDIKCKYQLKPDVSNTGVSCLSGEYLEVGYKVFGTFLNAYDVCFDRKNNVPLFAKHKVRPEHKNVWHELGWESNDLRLDFNRLYDCPNQMDDITRTLGRSLSNGSSCCFGKRQLVDSRSLLPSIPSSASFTYLNAVPQWSSCGSKNWDEVEQKVRDLATAAGREMTVATGFTSRPGTPAITLHDGHGRSQPVGQYIWKVVQDTDMLSSLAIIQVNIPDLTPEEARRHILCADVCDLIDWLQGPNWRNVEDGFTYCCTISEFERVFGYTGVFSHGRNKLLFDASPLTGSI